MFFEKETVKAKGSYKNHKEAPRAIIIAIIITAILTVGIFIYPDPFLNLATLFVNSVNK
jgi:formate hydrogenlyase subunit 3/multisubunit Na+/H+ antiporter MnhD subunit